MWKKILFSVSLLLGLAAFCLIPLLVGVEETLTTLQEAGLLCILAYTGVCAITLVFPAIGWWIFLRAEGVKVSLLVPIRANIMGFPINWATPSMYLGSEPLKLFYLSGVTGAPKRCILATMIVNKFQELVGLILVMLLGAGYCVYYTDLFSRGYEVVIILATVLLMILMGLLFYAFVGNFRPTVRVLNLLMRMGVRSKKLAKMRDTAEEMEAMVHAAFAKRWRRFLLAQLLTLASAVALFCRPIIFFLFVGERLGIPEAAAVYVVTNLIATFQIIPGSLGMFEGGILGVFALVGKSDQQAVALTLVNRISDVTLVVIALWLLAHYGLMSVARGKEKVELPIEEARREAAEESEKIKKEKGEKKDRRGKGEPPADPS